MQESVYDSFSQDTVAAAESLSAMLRKERITYRRRDYLRQPPSVDVVITESDRTKVVDWCYCIADHVDLDREVVIIAAEMVDRFLSLPGEAPRRTLGDRREFQLLAIAALYTSAKVHSAVIIDSSCVADMTRGAYSVEEIEEMEKSLLEGLSWRISAPTSVQVAHHVLSLVRPNVCLKESAWAIILDEIRYHVESAARDYGLSLRRSSTVAVAAILNSLRKVDPASQRAVLRALLPVMNEDFESPRHVLAVRNRLLNLVEGDDDLPTRDVMEAEEWSSTGLYCQEVEPSDLPRVESICDVSEYGLVDSNTVVGPRRRNCLR